MADYNEGDAESVGKVDWLLSSDFSSFPTLSTGSMNPYGLKNCWSYTQLGSQMLNTSPDSASIKKEKSQFQTF